jgi:hypothetical protein
MLGVAGACRCDELVHLKINDIEDVKSALEPSTSNSTKEPIAPEMIQEPSTTMTYTNVNNTSENLPAVDKSSLINVFQSCSNCTFHINIKN